MTKDCCNTEALQALQLKGQRRTLIIVLLINLLMFAVELGAGIWAESQALIADSADNLGDAMVYLLSLLVVGHSLRWRSGAAFIKGLIQLGFGLAIVASIIHSIMGEPGPVGPAMMGIATLALAANFICFMLLMRYRELDINMRSVWLCSRNDIIGNIAVIISGAAVMLLDSYWPDILDCLRCRPDFSSHLVYRP